MTKAQSMRSCDINSPGLSDRIVARSGRAGWHEILCGDEQTFTSIHASDRLQYFVGNVLLTK
jgi:hypothetical protein